MGQPDIGDRTRGHAIRPARRCGVLRKPVIGSLGKSPGRRFIGPNDTGHDDTGYRSGSGTHAIGNGSPQTAFRRRDRDPKPSRAPCRPPRQVFAGAGSSRPTARPFAGPSPIGPSPIGPSQRSGSISAAKRSSNDAAVTVEARRVTVRWPRSCDGSDRPSGPANREASRDRRRISRCSTPKQSPGKRH